MQLHDGWRNLASIISTLWRNVTDFSIFVPAGYSNLPPIMPCPCIRGGEESENIYKIIQEWGFGEVKATFTMHMSWLFVALSVPLKSRILAKSVALNRGSEIFDPRNRATKGFLRSRGVAAGPLRSLVARFINPPSPDVRDTSIHQLGQAHSSTLSLSLPSPPLVKTAIIMMVMRAMQTVVGISWW